MALSEELTNALKQLQNKMFSVSIEERPAIFQDIKNVLAHKDMNTKGFQGVTKLIAMTLVKYKDEASQTSVNELISEMCLKDPDQSIEAFNAIFKALCTKELVNAPPSKACVAALVALKWTFIIANSCNSSSNAGKTQYPLLMEYQSILYALSLQTNNTKSVEMAYEYFKTYWLDQTEESFQKYFNKFNGTEPTYNSFIILVAVLRFQIEEKADITFIEAHRKSYLNQFTKGLITVKTKLDCHLYIASQIYLNMLTEDEVKSNLLPAIQRSMLRSPETILEGVEHIISGLRCNVDGNGLDIGKVLIQNLHSKVDLNRTYSVNGLKQLAMKCSDSKTIETMMKNIFAILNGSEGKITVAEYRNSLLQGAGNLSYNQVPTEEITKLMPFVSENFIKIIDAEIQEKVICHGLEMFGLWSIFFTNELDSKVVQWFKKGLNHKSQMVKVSYLQWFLNCLYQTDLSSAADFKNDLLKIVEKASQSINQAPVLCEGLAAACILLSILSVKDESLTSFWNIVLDMKKEIFISEKFISNIGSESLCNLLIMSEKLLINFNNELKGEPIRLYKCILLAATSNIETVRAKAIKSIERLISTNSGMHFAKNILNELTKLMAKSKITLHSDEEIDENERSMPAEAIINILFTICSPNYADEKDTQSILNHAILAMHHDSIYSLNSELLEEILELNMLKGSDFISNNWEELQNVILNDYKCNSMYENSVAAIVNLNPEATMPMIVENVNTILNEVASVGIMDEEYFTYLTPEGELYDKSVMPSNEEEKTAHIKRENKAYSYKEQLEEIQLRREIEAKKQQAGKSKEPQYTPKQKEAIKNQLEKESQIRLKLTSMNDKLERAASQIQACFKGNSKFLSLHYSILLQTILRGLRSPLSALSLSNLYYLLGSNLFKGKPSVGRNYALATIRLLKPKCSLPDEWTKIDIATFISELFSTLEDDDLYEDFENEEDRFKDTPKVFDAPTFSFIFEFLKQTLLSEFVGQEELLTGIELISKHAQIKGTTINGDYDDFSHPKYLPTLEMLRLLLSLITNFDGQVQSQACSAFLDVSEALSGENHRSVASRDEIFFILQMLESSKEMIRDCAIRSLNKIMDVLPNIEDDNDLGLFILRRVWIAKHDVATEIQDQADYLWTKSCFEIPIALSEEILRDIIHDENCIQKAAAGSLVTILREDQSRVIPVLDKLLETYTEKLSLVPAVLDQFNREIVPAIDMWSPRRGVAITISQISQFFDLETVERIIQFMVSTGLRDREEIVHKEMLAASLEIVDLHGKQCVTTLLPVFEDFLDKAPNVPSFDNIRQAVVILMGSLARHLDKEDKRIEPIVYRLLTALATPSQQVQEAVANCIPHLIPSMKDQAPQVVKKLMNQLVKSDKYGERRGAAYGIAGLVKGLGILSLKQLDIMSKLTNHIQDKKNYKCREGALFAFEMLCSTLGRLFEPYIVHVLPHLLTCFGDNSIYVREAADETAKVVMRKLSAHGVKLVLPLLLAALDDESWRTKIAATEILGAMSHCAPKQLSSCLPSIVPKLMEILGDSHIKVQEAGGNALKMIGAVIKNPEIQAIVPILLRALEDPANKTSSCLQSLLKTKFVHFIDAPSLALIMPVVERAFMDRSTETRKMSAQIIGNMYSLTDPKDLTPYLDNIMPGLKASLLDPVPDVRTVSARALGAMVRGMGETTVGENLLPWLMQTLTSEASPVDRSGAAQGLAEVVAGLGVEKLHQTMPEIIKTAERTDIAPHVKDGYILMFIYMPQAFQEEFTVYIGQIINPILKALADENEYVRDTALKAGQRIVNLYAESAITLLLPELETGLFDDNWRIRYSSVQLLGDLLYKISGVTGKMSTQSASEDDNFGTEQSHKAIIRHLGIERRNRVLAGLYMGRSDVSLMVRQAALHVWKVVVTNTPRTLREILPTLFSLLLGCLGSKVSDDKRQVAARTLGDLVRKLGERVLPEIIPILEKGLDSECDKQRQGVCIGLSEIMASTSRDMVLTFVDSLVSTVRRALSDPLSDVRKAAARTFDSLHSAVGTKALDDILPSMLAGLSDEDPFIAECTLDGLKQIMAIKSRVVLPYLVPQLTAPPVNTKALSILCEAGEGLTKYLPKILPSILDSLSAVHGTPDELKETEYCQMIILAVSEDAGIRIIIDTLLDSCKSNKMPIKKAAASLLSVFCINSPGDYSNHIPQLLNGLMLLLSEHDKEILVRAWDALNAVTKTLDSAQQIAHVSDVRDAVKSATINLPPNSELPGFCLPKGIAPLLPVFREGILNGAPEEKECAAQSLGEVIALTSATSLQPSVVHITGPLIRILGDRFNSGVKSAVLETLAILLSKVGIMLKQFLPQLQTTFLKALNDPNRTVRMKAGVAVMELIKIHPKPDPVFVEIHNGIKNADDSLIRETMLQALRGILISNGDKMSELMKRQIYATLTSMLNYSEDTTRLCVAGCIGSFAKWISNDLLDDLSNQIFSDDFGEDWSLRHGRTAALFVLLKESPALIVTSKYEGKLNKTLVTCIQNEKVNIASNGVRGACYLLEFCQNEGQQIPQPILTAYVKSMNHTNNEIKQLLAKTSIYLSKVVPHEKMSSDFLKALIPMLVNGTKEKNGYVKSNSEIALISILRLRNGDIVFQKVLQLLEAGARDSLNEVVTKVLYRAMTASASGKDENIDDTILT
ncbi:unnamed protein product [Chironomus riparius]|uniref:TOG domain-containing protein n=1 Tax=Chironomus riparius TaxID=315576 RepID=A0A9N9S2Z8_9DIPT|nr:unnamed protein product [Chironomus riparius]